LNLYLDPSDIVVHEFFLTVMPVTTGIHLSSLLVVNTKMDSGVRRNDEKAPLANIIIRLPSSTLSGEHCHPCGRRQGVDPTAHLKR
jgi:hypothetical protein